MYATEKEEGLPGPVEDPILNLYLSAKTDNFEVRQVSRLSPVNTLVTVVVVTATMLVMLTILFSVLVANIPSEPMRMHGWKGSYIEDLDKILNRNEQQG